MRLSTTRKHTTSILSSSDTKRLLARIHTFAHSLIAFYDNSLNDSLITFVQVSCLALKHAQFVLLSMFSFAGLV